MEMVPEWREHWDETHGQAFYYNEMTGETTWERPPDEKIIRTSDTIADGVDGAGGGGVAMANGRRFDEGPETAIHAGTVDTPESASTAADGEGDRDGSNDQRTGDDRYGPADSAGGMCRADGDAPAAIGGELAGSMPVLPAGMGAEQEDGTVVHDYLRMADEYRRLAKYRDASTGPTCVLCHREAAQQIFFPCGHCCVCTTCVRKHGFGASGIDAGGGALGTSWSLCPVCCDEIKHVVRYEGPVMNAEQKKEAKRRRKRKRRRRDAKIAPAECGQDSSNMQPEQIARHAGGNLDEPGVGRGSLAETDGGENDEDETAAGGDTVPQLPDLRLGARPAIGKAPSFRSDRAADEASEDQSQDDLEWEAAAKERAKAVAAAEAKYWAWAHETGPALPPAFRARFRHSKAFIQHVYLDDDSADKCCTVS